MNFAPTAYWNAHLRKWDTDDGTAPEIEGDGLIEVYAPTENGTEDLPRDSNEFEVEYAGEYETLEQAIASLDSRGRFLISKADRGKYLGHLNCMQGGVEVVIY